MLWLWEICSEAAIGKTYAVLYPLLPHRHDLRDLHHRQHRQSDRKAPQRKTVLAPLLLESIVSPHLPPIDRRHPLQSHLYPLPLTIILLPLCRGHPCLLPLRKILRYRVRIFPFQHQLHQFPLRYRNPPLKRFHRLQQFPLRNRNWWHQ